MDLAFQTYWRDVTWLTPLFDAALAHNDLNAAKAANVVEENALHRYLESLDTIKWPEGFEGQVNDLRDKLRKMIEFDRRRGRRRYRGAGGEGPGRRHPGVAGRAGCRIGSQRSAAQEGR